MFYPGFIENWIEQLYFSRHAYALRLLTSYQNRSFLSFLSLDRSLPTLSGHISVGHLSTQHAVITSDETSIAKNSISASILDIGVNLPACPNTTQAVVVSRFANFLDQLPAGGTNSSQAAKLIENATRIRWRSNFACTMSNSPFAELELSR